MTTVTPAKTGPAFRGLSRLRHLRHTRGYGRLSYALLQRSVSLPVLRHCLRACAGDLYSLSLDSAKQAPRLPKSFEVRAATADDGPALSAYYGDAQQVQSRFGRGDSCVITTCREEIVAAVWIVIGPGTHCEDWHDLHSACEFPARVAWIYDGKGTKLGAWGALMGRLPELLRKQGVNELAALIDCNNWPALDAHRSLGYQRVATVGCLGAFGLCRSACLTANRRWRRLPATIASIKLLAHHPEKRGASPFLRQNGETG